MCHYLCQKLFLKCFCEEQANVDHFFKVIFVVKGRQRFIFHRKKPLGFHNFSRTPNPRFYERIDEFIVARAAFLGSPNP